MSYLIHKRSQARLNKLQRSAPEGATTPLPLGAAVILRDAASAICDWKRPISQHLGTEGGAAIPAIEKVMVIATLNTKKT